MSNHHHPATFLNSAQHLQQIRNLGLHGAAPQAQAQPAAAARRRMARAHPPPAGGDIVTYFGNITQQPPRAHPVAASVNATTDSLQQKRVKLLVLPIMAAGGGNVAAATASVANPLGVVAPKNEKISAAPASTVAIVTAPVLAPATAPPAPKQQRQQQLQRELPTIQQNDQKKNVPIAFSKQKAISITEKKESYHDTTTTITTTGSDEETTKEKRTSNIVSTSWVKRLEDFYSRVHPLVLRRISRMVERSDHQTAVNYQRDVVILLAATGQPPRLFPPSFQPDAKADVILIGPPPTCAKEKVEQKQDARNQKSSSQGTVRGDSTSNQFIRCIAQYAPVYGKLYQGGVDMEREAHSLVGQLVQYINSRGGRFLHHVYGRDQWAESSLYAACNFTEMELFREACKQDPNIKRKQSLHGPMEIPDSEDEDVDDDDEEEEALQTDSKESNNPFQCCPCKMNHVKRKRKICAENGKTPSKRRRKNDDEVSEEEGVVQAPMAEVAYCKPSATLPSPEDASNTKKSVTKRLPHPSRNRGSTPPEKQKKNVAVSKKQPSKIKKPVTSNSGQAKKRPAHSDEEIVSSEERDAAITMKKLGQSSTGKTNKTPPSRTQQHPKNKRSHSSSDEETVSDDEGKWLKYDYDPSNRPDQGLAATTAWELRDASELFYVTLPPEQEALYSREEQMRRLRMEQHYLQMRRYMEEQEAHMLIRRMVEQQGPMQKHSAEREYQDQRIKDWYQRELKSSEGQNQECRLLKSNEQENEVAVRCKKGQEKKGRGTQKLASKGREKTIEDRMESSNPHLGSPSSPHENDKSENAMSPKKRARRKPSVRSDVADKSEQTLKHEKVQRSSEKVSKHELLHRCSLSDAALEKTNDTPVNRQKSSSSEHSSRRRKPAPSVPEQKDAESNEESEPRVAEVSDEKSAASESMSSYAHYHQGQPPVMLESFSPLGGKNEVSLGGGLFNLFSGFTQRLASVFSSKGDSGALTSRAPATVFHNYDHAELHHLASYNDRQRAYERSRKKSHRPTRKDPPVHIVPKQTKTVATTRNNEHAKSVLRSSRSSKPSEKNEIDPMQLLINACEERWEDSDFIYRTESR